MNQNYNETPNGYLESINKGIQTARKLSGHMTRSFHFRGLYIQRGEIREILRRFQGKI